MATCPRWLTLATHVPANGSGGGMVRVAVEFLHSAALREDIEPHVLCRPESIGFFTDLLGSRDQVHATPGPANILTRSAYERFALSVVGRGFDVIHGTKHLLPHHLPAGTRPRMVLTVHDMIFLDRPGDFPGLKGVVLREPYLASIRGADALTCISEATRQRLLSFVPSAEPRTRVIPLATPQGLQAAESLPVPDLQGRPFVLVVGDDSARKNLGLLARAMEKVKEQVPGAVLAIVGGKNWGETASADALRSATEAGHILPLGYRSDGELRWCYENAAVVCCPSMLEGFGLPAVEARAFRRPLITSDDPALVEVSGDVAVQVGSQLDEEWVEPLICGLRGLLPPSDPPPDWTWDDFVTATLTAGGIG